MPRDQRAVGPPIPLRDAGAAGRVVRVLGRGGNAITYEAEDLSTGGRVAVKQLVIWKRAEWKALDLFEREARVLSNLTHPSIPRYIDYLKLDGAQGRREGRPPELRRERTIGRLCMECQSLGGVTWRRAERPPGHVAPVSDRPGAGFRARAPARSPPSPERPSSRCARES
ncbi:hypothetical protein WMF27_05195 [Sorangium sp. So ce281]|uniref:hypothetical protein n=1 Tax=unclassified Sorangium TaxID=2621164 RepID=UPI003F632748